MIRRVLGLAALAVCLAAAPQHGASAQGAADIFSGFQANSTDPVEVDAQSLEIFEEGDQRIAVFGGGVAARRGDTVIRAASIKLYADIDAASPDAFTRIEANGDIFVRSGDQTVTGASAVVNMVDKSIVVGGGIVLAQGSNVISGSRLVVNMATGRARIEQNQSGGRIRGVFAPGGS